MNKLIILMIATVFAIVATADVVVVDHRGTPHCARRHHLDHHGVYWGPHGHPRYYHAVQGVNVYASEVAFRGPQAGVVYAPVIENGVAYYPQPTVQIPVTTPVVIPQPQVVYTTPPQQTTATTTVVVPPPPPRQPVTLVGAEVLGIKVGVSL